MCPLDAPAQGLLLCAPARTCGRFGPGARGYLGAPLAPVGACRCCGGHRVTLSAESAGVREVGGRRPRVEMAEPEVVPPLSEGVPDLQQAGADAAPVVLAKRLPLDLLPRVAGEDPVVVEGGDEVVPRRAGVPLVGARHVHVAPGEVGRQRVPLAPVRGVPVEEGQQGAVRDRFPPHSQPFAAVQLLAQRGCDTGGEHEEQGPLCVAQPGQGVVVYRPPRFEVRHGELGGPVLWGLPPDGGRSVSPRAYLRGPEHVGSVKDDAGRDGRPDE